MTARSPARHVAPDRPIGVCHCGRALGPSIRMPATVNHGPVTVRRCPAGHSVTAPAAADHDFDFRPQTTGDLEA